MTFAIQVWGFPAGAQSLTEHPRAFALLALCGLLTSFTSTLMFTSLGSFFNRISDPAMGGAYLTLLNTIANMGKPLLSHPQFQVVNVVWTHAGGMPVAIQ